MQGGEDRVALILSEKDMLPRKSAFTVLAFTWTKDTGGKDDNFQLTRQTEFTITLNRDSTSQDERINQQSKLSNNCATVGSQHYRFYLANSIGVEKKMSKEM